VPLILARRAAELRRRTRKGSAVDALVIALAEPNGAVLTSDVSDLDALAAQTNRVTVVGVEVLSF
jgi:sirohydrochlorin ferrochelatase